MYEFDNILLLELDEEYIMENEFEDKSYMDTILDLD